MILYDDLERAIINGDNNFISDFIEQSFAEKDKPLVRAILENKIENVISACEQGANPKILEQEEGFLLLAVILEFHYSDILIWLFKESGTQFSDQSMLNEMMAFAAAHGYLEGVQWLIKVGAQGDARDSDLDDTAFLWAVGDGYLDVAQWLVNEGHAHVTELSSCKESALELAAKGGHLTTIQWLTKALQIDQAVLVAAGKQNHVVVFQWLVEQVGENFHKHNVNESGRTLFLDNAMRFHFDIATWLLKTGRAIATERDTKNKNALELMVWPHIKEEQKAAYLSFLQMLFESGIGINMNLTGFTFELMNDCTTANWVLIGATVNDEPFSYPGAINTLDDLRERIGDLSIQQIKDLRKSVAYLLTRDPANANLLKMQSILKNSVTLKQHCLFFIEKNPQVLPEKYTEILPAELAEQVNNIILKH